MLKSTLNEQIYLRPEFSTSYSRYSRSQRATKCLDIFLLISLVSEIKFINSFDITFTVYLELIFITFFVDLFII